MQAGASEVDILTLFKCRMIDEDEYDDETEKITRIHRPTHMRKVQIYNNFMTGWWRSKGNKEGQYPDNYIAMINGLFGREPNTIEVCSRYVQVDRLDTAATVDINPAFQPTYCTNAETLAGVPSMKFKRARGDPPYTLKWAQEVYGTGLPNFAAMLKSMARVTEIGGLIFMLMGQGCIDIQRSAEEDRPMHSGNLQECKPYGLKRIGVIAISVVPNKEYRFLNIYYKFAHPEILEREGMGGQSTLV